jgi:hypothetical protein
MFNIQCEDLMMLRFSNTKLSILFKILSLGEAPRVELDTLLDKTTVQGLCASQGLNAVIHWYKFRRGLATECFRLRVFLVTNNAVNSLTDKCVPAGTKNSLSSEDFLLVKHTSHKHPHHDEPFSLLVAWF